MSEMREAELRGTLINKAGVMACVFTWVRLQRDMLLGIPDRLPLPRESQLLLRRAIEEVLHDSVKNMPPLIDPRVASDAKSVQPAA